MGPLKTQGLLLCLTTATGAIFLAVASEVWAQEDAAPRPQVTYEKTHTALIEMTKDGCGVSGTARFEPPFPPGGVRLNVGDSYEITATNIASRAVVANWAGEWSWVERCGKKGKDRCPQKKPAAGPSSVVFGENYKVFLSTGGEPVELLDSPLKSFAEKQDTLHLSAIVSAFPAPDNPKPHQNAHESKPLCAKVAATPAHIADVAVRIVSRYQ